MDQKKMIHGFGISQYRSYRGQIQYCGPFSKINVIIGPNNAGKSNLLRYIAKVYPDLINGLRESRLNTNLTIDARELPQGTSEQPQVVPILFPMTDELITQAFRLKPHDAIAILTAREVLTLYRGNPQDESACIPLIASNQDLILPRDFPTSEINSKNLANKVRSLWTSATNMTDGTLEQHWLPGTLSRYAHYFRAVPEVVFIEALRQIPTSIKDYEDRFVPAGSEGAELVLQIDRMSRPTFDQQAEKHRFRKILNFVRRVLKNPSLEIEIPHDKSTITILDGDKSLPIEDLGTGVMQVIILAVRAVLSEGKVVCIEEPELHLHPELQRQLIFFLKQETDNQYFISTHSAHIMDYAGGPVLAVEMYGDETRVTTPISRQDRRSVTDILGYRPSDLLQSNCLIWVEGPSDRIYLNYWISQVDKSLVEGWHYSILFYGGRVLSHFSADDDESEVAELVKVLPIGRHAAFIMDSDVKKRREKIGANKLRIAAEIEKVGGLSWITEGREIENYIPAAFRSSAVKAIHKKAQKLADADGDKYCHPLAYIGKDGATVDTGLAKVKIAKHIVDQQPPADTMDLVKRVAELCAFVRKANGITE